MSDVYRKREQLKLYLNGVKSVIEETCRDEHVSLPARQVLTAAVEAICSALSRWDIPFITNADKSWRDIMQEVSHDSSVLWSYLTVLRGPDSQVACASTAKAILTCPLRGRCVHALGVKEFSILSAGEIKRGFINIYEHRNELNHYLRHIVAIWDTFYPPLGKLLESVFFWDNIEPRKAAIQYIELLNRWLRSKSVIVDLKDEIGGSNE